MINVTTSCLGVQFSTLVLFVLQQTTKPASPPQLLFSSVRYFIMKSSNVRNIDISQQKGIWSTTPSNEAKLTKAFLENSAIILVFSVQGSGHFQVLQVLSSGVFKKTNSSSS